jgi:hypothetical protein
MQCQGPGCTKHVQQKEGGHRARKYCSDACRVAAHRATARAEEAARANDNACRAAAEKEAEAARERQEIRNRYPTLTDASLDLLLSAKQQYGLHAVEAIGSALVREQETSGDERVQYTDLQEANRQTSKHIAYLEREIRRYQRMEITESRDSMLGELMLLGGRLQYVCLTDLGIRAGIDEWLKYARGASNRDLAAAIAHGYYQADQLAMAAIEASDHQRERRLCDRIHKLERLTALQAHRVHELEHGAGENIEEAAGLSQEDIAALVYQARERALLLEQQARQIEEMEGTVRARINEIHRLEESHSSTMYQMNLLLAEAQSAAQRVQAEGEPASQLLDNEQQRAALAQLLLASGKEQKYPELRLSGYFRLFPGCFTENDLPDISQGKSAWQKAVAKLSGPALLIALVSMQARHALEEQRSIASEHAWREHLSLEEARKEASDYAGKYYQIKAQLEQAASASIATNGEQSADAEKTRIAQELESLRTLIAKQEQALAVRSDTVIKRGATIRAQEKAIQEQKNQLAKVTDELEHARLVISAREADIQELVRAPHIDSAVENAALKQSLAITKEGWSKTNKELDRLKKKLASKEPFAAIKQAEQRIRELYHLSVHRAEEEKTVAQQELDQLKSLVAQRGQETLYAKIEELEQSIERMHAIKIYQECHAKASTIDLQILFTRQQERFAWQVAQASELITSQQQQLTELTQQREQANNQEKPVEWMSEPSFIVLQVWQSCDQLTEQQLEWIKWQAIKDASAHYTTALKEEDTIQAIYAYFRFANVPDQAEQYIPASLKKTTQPLSHEHSTTSFIVT